MIPSLATPGVMTPGQLGPTRTVDVFWRKFQTLAISKAGMPSVMQTTSPKPAAAPSMIASAAMAGGTKMTPALAPLFSTASDTVSKTGNAQNFLTALCPE